MTEKPKNSVYIQAVDYSRHRSEPGQILHQFGPEWAAAGISPDNMLRGVEYIYGSRLPQIAQVALGGWAQELAEKNHNQQAATQGEQ